MSLSSAYKQSFFWYRNWQNNVKRIVADLKRHGKFLIFSVYPTSLNKIDKFVSDFDKIDNGLKTVDKIAERSFGPYEKDVWYHLLGIMELEQESLKAPNKMQALKAYEQTAKTVKEEQADLLNRLKHLIAATDGLKKQFLGDLEEFLKSNSLPLEPIYDTTY